MKILIAPYSQKLRNGKRNPKEYPYWPELVALLKNHTITQIGVEGEQGLVPDFRKGLPYKEIKALINECHIWISVDSFLPHLAQFTNKSGVVLWGPSDPLIYGYPNNNNILKDRACLRPDQFNIWEALEYDPNKFVKAYEVINLIFQH